MNALTGCGACKLCCKVMAVPELDKPRGTWCKHCDVRAPGGGCTVHDAQPAAVCGDFECVWLQMNRREPGGWKPELRPDRSHVVLTTANDGATLLAHVDPSYASAAESGPMGRYLANMIKQRKLSLVIAIGDLRRAYLSDGRSVAFRNGDRMGDETTIVAP